MRPTNRRQFLRGLGLTGLASATLPGILSRQARAASGDAPKRLIIVSTGHGTVHEHWKMHPGGEPEDATWETSLTGLAASEWSRSLAPLQPYASRINVFDGLAMCSAERDIPGYRHEKGWIHAWTGASAYFTGSDLFSTAPSLDQLVAAELARDDRLPSLELDVWEGRPICHAGLAQQLPLEPSPRRAYDRLFGLSTSSDPLVAAQGSVLDFASAEHQAIRGRLSTTDRDRLDTHFDLIRQLEARIAGLSEASCPTAPDRGVLTSEEAEYDALFRSMVDVVAAAFSCDFTRVATLSLGDIPSDDFGWGWYLSGDAHNDFAHRIYTDTQASEAMADYVAYHTAQLAYLIGVLEQIPDAAGGSLMDHTLIVFASEMGDGWHGYQNWNALTIGGDWAWQTGRYLHFPDATTSPFSLALPDGSYSSGAGLPHQHLLVSVAQAMGLADDVVGMSELTAKSGERWSLSGGVPGLV